MREQKASGRMQINYYDTSKCFSNVLRFTHTHTHKKYVILRMRCPSRRHLTDHISTQGTLPHAHERPRYCVAMYSSGGETVCGRATQRGCRHAQYAKSHTVGLRHVDYSITLHYCTLTVNTLRIRDTRTGCCC